MIQREKNTLSAIVNRGDPVKVSFFGVPKLPQLALMRLARGLYRLTSTEEFSNPDLAVVAAKAPEAVVCLISALAFHGITTQVPRVVHLAVPRGRYAGLRLRTPPVRIYRFDVPTFYLGSNRTPSIAFPFASTASRAR